MSTETHEHQGPAYLQHHFHTPVQQFSAAKLGMWAFLSQEVLFFSGLFVAYGIFRSWYPEAFSVASHLLDWKMGGINTCVLLLSSFTAAMSVRSAQKGTQNQTSMWIVLTILFALGFMVIKYFEYAHKFHVGFAPGEYFAPSPEGMEEISHAMQSVNHLSLSAPPPEIRSFFGIYFMMTGVHGIHVLIGIFVFIWMLVRNVRGEFSPEFFTPVDLAALYWHLVDLIWIYLFPLLYLID
ncbi:MAG: cytochrome c oxidase subunit 3 family protein [Myxococcota bacterium]